MKRLILGLAALLLASAAPADVQLVLKGAGGTSTLSSNGSLVRIEEARMPGFVIVDAGSGIIHMVDTQRGQVMRSEFGAAGVDAAPVAIELKDRGGGQKIAGFLTRKYQFSANGEACGTIYASSKLLRQPEIQAMFDSMRGLQQQSRGFVGGFGGMMPLCQRANLQLAEELQSAGVPMRILGVGGELVSEIISVDTDKKFPASHFELPAGMDVVDLGDQINQAAGQTRQMLQNMPDMNELMEQMQDSSGQMNEQMQQQMQQLQEMLQQLQQQ